MRLPSLRFCFVMSLCLFVAQICIFVTPALGQLRETRRVVVLSELGLSSPAVAAVVRDLDVALQADPTYRIEFYSEYLETALFPDEASQADIRAWFIRKYQVRKPDVIIAVGPTPTKFMVDAHEKFFSGIPIVFCCTTEQEADYPKVDGHFTGTWLDFDTDKTLEMAVRLLPRTKRVVVVGGVSDFDRHLEDLVRQTERKHETLQFTYLTNLPMETIFGRVKHLPHDSIVLFTSVSVDGAGRKFNPNPEIVRTLALEANAPVFTLADTLVGQGAVGGYVVRYLDQGKPIAAITSQVLRGTKPQEIISRQAGTYMFDWSAMRRWGIEESRLPPGRIVLNRQPSFWLLYWRYVIAGVVLLLLQTLIIGGLLWQRAARRKMQAHLAIEAKALAKLNDWSSRLWRTRKLQQGLDEMLVGVLELLGACKGHVQILDVSRSVLVMVAQHGFEQPFLEYFREVFGENPSGCGRALRRGERVIIEDVENDPVDDTLHSLRRASGYRATVSTPLTNSEGNLLGMITTHFRSPHQPSEESLRRLDLYAHQAAGFIQRCQAEEAMRESEERFRRVANTAPVMIWMSGVDKLLNYVNRPCIEFTGLPSEALLDNGWTEGIDPGDVDRIWNTYIQAFDRREPFQVEYRFRRHDGQYRWVIDSGVPRFNADSSFAGYIGTAADVTERKLAEEALSTLNRKLIEAQEEERTRIARELHDDVNQRIALLAVNLERLKQGLPSSATELSQEIGEAGKQLEDLGSDVQALSHRLHSSKLDILGLAAAAAGLCRELSNQQGVEIDFRSAHIQEEPPREVSLCLFRVLQEALHNAIKHSGSRLFQVLLSNGSDEIELTVRDLGRGFDPEENVRGNGLGLMSVRERLKLVNGDLSIDSAPQRGTTIRARVPLISSAKSASAAV